MTNTTHPSAVRSTQAESVNMPRIEQRTEISTDVLAGTAGALRSIGGIFSENTAQIHGETLYLQLETRTRAAAKKPPAELLLELSSLGFAWTDIARIVGVSIPALRKWRQGESMTGENRHKLARLTALVAVLRDDHWVQDVASWLDIPIGEPYFTGIAVLEAGGYEDLIAYAGEHMKADDLLDRWIPAWREQANDGFEVFVAGDGERAIRAKASD